MLCNGTQSRNHVAADVAFGHRPVGRVVATRRPGSDVYEVRLTRHDGEVVRSYHRQGRPSISELYDASRILADR